MNQELAAIEALLTKIDKQVDRLAQQYEDIKIDINKLCSDTQAMRDRISDHETRVSVLEVKERSNGDKWSKVIDAAVKIVVGVVLAWVLLKAGLH